MKRRDRRARPCAVGQYWKCKYNAYLYVTKIGNIIRNNYPRVPLGRNLLSRKAEVWTRCIKTTSLEDVIFWETSFRRPGIW